MRKKNFLIAIPLICFLVSCSPKKVGGYYIRNVECETYEEAISQIDFMNLYRPEGKLVSFDFLPEEYKESDRHYIINGINKPFDFLKKSEVVLFDRTFSIVFSDDFDIVFYSSNSNVDITVLEWKPLIINKERIPTRCIHSSAHYSVPSLCSSCYGLVDGNDVCAMIVYFNEKLTKNLFDKYKDSFLDSFKKAFDA